ncbi:DNA-binding protein RFXANK [Dufourea novaeangliae]|uniref:DNA-binding protein RFXANK n=1 Tax=Dufourea novaeangliae TaxID=178035 RepID=A0A154NWL9_DUFNO|nr:DNA-binding protein RFXANK [Dufourea novaeangliae]
MENQIHSELIMKEEEMEEGEQELCNTNSTTVTIVTTSNTCTVTNATVTTTATATETKSTTRNGAELAIGIRPRPLICKPDNPPTLLTNLQRGNTQTEIPQLYSNSDITFHTLAGQGELTPEQINANTVDAPDEKGLTGLMWAAGYGQLGSARQLLKAGANKNYRGLNGETPLHLAAAYGHHDLVKLLLNHGADSNASDEEGNTPLIYGAYGDHPHVCYELLSRGADVTKHNMHNISAYHAAVLNSSLTAKAVIENYLLQQVVNLPDML